MLRWIPKNKFNYEESEFYPEKMSFIGVDKIIKKTNNNINDIRFHVEPNIKLMKTQDNKTI